MPLEYSGHIFGRRVRTTGGVHKQEVIGKTVVGEVQAEGGIAASARRESGCAEPGDGPAVSGTVGLAE